MKYKIILFGFMAALITGCSSAYKASQTPDDVYYSPARSGGAHREARSEDRYEDYVSSQEDRYLRMKIRNRDRWSTIDDYAYWNDSRYMPLYSYDYYRNNWNRFSYWNSPYSWNNPFALNNWYSPYYSPFYSGGLGFGYYGGLGLGNFYGGYGYSPYSNVYISKYPRRVAPNVNRPALRGYSNRNYDNNNRVYNREGFGNTMRKVFSPSENSGYSNRNINMNRNNNNNTYRAPERTYSPSSGGSFSGGSSSGGSGGGGGISRPPR